MATFYFLQVNSFNWVRSKDINVRDKMILYEQPVACNKKLYGSSCDTVLEYTPTSDQWAVLPPPPVHSFTVATLRGQLLVVGGVDKSTGDDTNTIFTFNQHSQQWVQKYAAMPTAVTVPTVVGYQNHLIVAAGEPSDMDYEFMPNVNILNTASNEWITAQPLPRTDHYYTVLIEDTIFLIGRHKNHVLRAHVPTLMSGAKSGAWERLRNVPYSFSSPIAIGNTLLTVGGSLAGDPTSSIQMYNPITNQWTGVGELSESMSDCHCIVLSGQLFVLGGFNNPAVYVANVHNH